MATFIIRYLRNLFDVNTTGAAPGDVLGTADGVNWIPVAGGGGGGAPANADYLVGTANASLTNEIVVGPTPGGELGGTWASPTVPGAVITAPASSARNLIIPTLGTVTAMVTRAHAAQSVNLAEWQLNSTALAWGLSKEGSEILAATAVPADADVPNSQRWQWYEDTVGAPSLRFIQRDSAGTLFKGRALSSNYNDGSVRFASDAGAPYTLSLVGSSTEAFDQSILAVENFAGDYAFTVHGRGAAIVWGPITQQSLEFYTAGADLNTELDYWAILAREGANTRLGYYYGGGQNAITDGFPFYVGLGDNGSGRVRLGAILQDLAQSLPRATVDVVSGFPGAPDAIPTLGIRTIAAPTDDLVAWTFTDAGTDPYASRRGGVKLNGSLYTRVLTAPADAILFASDLAWWYDSTNGAAKWMAKGKTADGTVVTWTIPSGTSYVAGGTDVALADGGTGASLVDPGADRIMFWDDSAGTVTWLTAGTNLTITGTTIDAAGGGGSVATDAIWDAKGDLAAATAPDTAVALPIGADGLVLTADSVEATGMKWAAGGGGGGGNTEIETFTAGAAQSWTMPADCVAVEVICIGAGGGGGGGASAVSTAKGGGCGGGGGGVSRAMLRAADISSPVTVNVGAGGAGGAGGAAGAGADGANGSDGGASNFGTHLKAGAGGGGQGGTAGARTSGAGGSAINSAVGTTAGVPGSATAIGAQAANSTAGPLPGLHAEYGGGSGGSSGVTGTGGAQAGGSSIYGGPGGGIGGRVSVTNVGVAPSAGGATQSYAAGGGGAAGTSGVTPTAGGNGTFTGPYCGTGGGGGGSGTAVAGAAGGTGGIGAGGGGGGTSSHAVSSAAGAAGGAGGAGRVHVIAWIEA